MTIDSSTESSSDLLLPGYYLDPVTGAWMTLPWPEDLADLPPSLAPGIIRWAQSGRLRHHITGDNWTFTRGQKRFLHMWYALDEEGEWLFPNGCKRGAKGTGKDPLCAVMSLAEGWGPTLLDHFEESEDGRLVAVGKSRQMALVQIASNSESQSKDVMRVANAIMTPAFKLEEQIDAGITATYSRSGARLEVLTFSERSSEGDPTTAGFLNETHHMTQSSGGHKVAAVLHRNVTKSPIYVKARVLELTNAHLQGADSVAERTFLAWQAEQMGKTVNRTILYDSIEANPALDITNPKDVEQAISQAYMDSPWTDKRRIQGSVQDIRTPVGDAVRYYFNGLGVAEDAWIDPRNFDAGARPKTVLEPRDQITIFLDCSKSGDATALVGCRLADGFIFTLGVWENPSPSTDGWLVPRHEVDMVVRDAFDTFKVVWFGVDISSAVDDDDESRLYWQDMCDSWHRDFQRRLKVWATGGTVKGHAVIYDLRMSSYGGKDRNKLFTEACMLAAKDIDMEKSLHWDGHPKLRKHTFNARRRPNDWGVALSKESPRSRNWVDGATAMVGARLGRRLALNSGKVKVSTGEFMG